MLEVNQDTMGRQNISKSNKPQGTSHANLNSHQQCYDFYKLKQITVNKKSHIHKTNSKMTPHYHLEKEGNQKDNI